MGTRFFTASVVLIIVVAFGNINLAAVKAGGEFKDLRGANWGNFTWLDPLGRFPNKISERKGISDSELFGSLVKKAKLMKAKSIEIIIYSYRGEAFQEIWLEVQKDRIRGICRELPGASLILRPYHNPYTAPDKNLGLQKAVDMAFDFAPIINDITQLCQGADGLPQIFIIIGNEPNLPYEGFNQDPEYFNEWFKTVVWYFWNVTPIPNKKDGQAHAIFYPGLAPVPYDIAWYKHKSTMDILHPTLADPNNPGRHLQQSWANGIVLNVYWEKDKVKDIFSGERYKLVWDGAISMINPYLPVIIGEWGNMDYSDMDSVKSYQYKDWLAEIGRQTTIPNIVSANVFILDGTDDWERFFLTEYVCRELGKLFGKSF